MDNKTVSYEKPDPLTPEHKKDREFYIQNIRHYTTFYNKPFSDFLIDKSESTMGKTSWDYLTPVEQMRRCYSYMLGRQSNFNFNHLNSGGGNSAQATWINGQKVPQLINNMRGNMKKILSGSQISVNGISKGIKNKRNKLVQEAILRQEYDDVFSQLREDYGVDYEPIKQAELAQDEDDLMRLVEMTPIEYGEVVAKNIGDSLFNRNKIDQTALGLFTDAIVAGLTQCHVYAENGKVKHELINPMSSIWDSSVTDDFNRKRKFGGFVTQKTVEEVIARWGKQLHESEKQEIVNLSKERNAEFEVLYNSQKNITWWDYNASGSLNTVSVATVYWFQLRDTRYKKKEVKYKGKTSYNPDDEIVKKINDEVGKNSEVSGDYWVLDICKGTLIANKYLVDWGYASNIVENPENPSDPIIPIFTYIPNMVLDQYRSVVSKLADFQDEIDQCAYKIRELIGRDIGKSYIVNGKKLGITSAQSVLADFKSMNISVQVGTSGEANDPDDKDRLIEYVDLTLDQNVMRYVELMNVYTGFMEEVASIPKVAQGQNPAYIGRGVQQATLAQSSLSLITIYEGFLDWLSELMQYGVNMQKNIWFFNKETLQDAESIIGSTGVNWLINTKNVPFEYYGVKINFGDIISDTDKQELFSLTQAYMNNPDHDAFLNILKLKQTKTYTEGINQLEYFIKKRKQEQMQAQAAQAEQDAIMKQSQIQSNENIASMQQVAADDRQDKQINADLLKANLASSRKGVQ